MKPLAAFGLAVGGLLGGLAAGVSVGMSIGKRSAVTPDLVALSFSGNRAALAFEEMSPDAAWPILSEHRLLVTSRGNALNDGLRHMELMLVAARLALLARELNRDDSTWRAEAASECKRAGVKDCTPARLEFLARRRGGAR